MFYHVVYGMYCCSVMGGVGHEWKANVSFRKNVGDHGRPLSHLIYSPIWGSLPCATSAGKKAGASKSGTSTATGSQSQMSFLGQLRSMTKMGRKGSSWLTRSHFSWWKTCCPFTQSQRKACTNFSKLSIRSMSCQAVNISPRQPTSNYTLVYVQQLWQRYVTQNFLLWRTCGQATQWNLTSAILSIS